MTRPCGLLKTNSKEPVPLDTINLHVEIDGLAAHARLILKYFNKEENPIEAIYVMPIDEDASVCGFRAKVGERTIIGRIQGRDEAREIYDDAIASGHSAYLMEESAFSSDILQLSVGNLPAQSSVTVEVEFVLELRMEGSSRAIFDFPRVLIPRYTPAGQGSATQLPPPASEDMSPGFFTFTSNINSATALKSIELPNEEASVNYCSDDKRKAEVSLTKEHNVANDIQLHVVTEESLKPYAVVEPGDISCEKNEFLSSPVVMANLIPVFPDNVKKEIPCEVVFVVDRSGSMRRGAMKSAQETLLLCLKSLPVDCYFNVVGFGSRYETLFPQSVKFCDENLDKACKQAKSMQADLGGTEILQPLKWIYSQSQIPGYFRQVILLTDGGVSNTKQVIDAVRENAKVSRVFSIGIGEGASTSLVKGVARAGNGKFDFVTTNDRLQKKVIKLLKCAQQPLLSDITVDWKIPADWKITPTGTGVSALYDRENIVMYGYLTAKDRGSSLASEVTGSVELKGKIGSMDNEVVPLSQATPFQMKNSACNKASPYMLHHLAGKKSIQELQDMYTESECREKMVKMSKDASVLSKLTSFVAVNQETLDPVGKPMMQRNIHSFKVSRVLEQGVPSSSPRTLSSLPCLGSPPAPPAPCAAVDSSRRTRSSLPCLGSPPSPPAPLSSYAAVDKSRRTRQHSTTKKRFRFREDSADLVYSSLSSCRGAVRSVSPPSLSKPSGADHDSYSEDKMMSVVDLQKAAGNWVLSEKLLLLLDLKMEALGQLLVSEDIDLLNDEDASLFATALVVCWLALKYSEQRDEWEMLVGKADKWMLGNMKKDTTMDKLMALARKAFE